jgi:hypothetical protein
MPDRPDPLPDLLALCHVVDVLMAWLAITDSREDRQILHQELGPLAGGNPRIRGLVDALVAERSRAECLRTYVRAKAEAETWARRTATACP